MTIDLESAQIAKEEMLGEIVDLDRKIVDEVIKLRSERSKLIAEAIHVHEVQIMDVAAAVGSHASDISATDYGVLERVPADDSSWVNRQGIMAFAGLNRTQLATECRAGRVRAGLKPSAGGTVRTVFKWAE